MLKAGLTLINESSGFLIKADLFVKNETLALIYRC